MDELDPETKPGTVPACVIEGASVAEPTREEAVQLHLLLHLLLRYLLQLLLHLLLQ